MARRQKILYENSLRMSIVGLLALLDLPASHLVT